MITRAQGAGLVAALTFDDGPNGATTLRLLDFLRANRILATFCVVGASVRAPGGADVLRQTVVDGHVLANHTTSHADLGEWSDAEIRADLTDNLAIIRDAVGDPGLRVPFFRAPNGHWGRSEAVAAELGLGSLAVVNTIDDWLTQDVATLTANLRSAMRPGELVLVHDGGGDREGSVDAVIAVLTERLEAGWRFTLPAHE